MKFNCEKRDLLDIINIVSRAVAVKSPSPAQEGIKLDAEDSTVRLTAYDLKRGIYSSLDAQVLEGGSIILGARIFGEIVRNLPEGTVSISTRSGFNTRISCGNSEYDIIGSDSADFAEIPDVEAKSGVGLPQNLLGEMIRQTMFAISDNEARPIYTGELFEISGGFLTAVAVDGYRLAMRKEALEGHTEDCRFIVPGKSLSDLEKLCGDSQEPVDIQLGDKHISFTLGRTVLMSRRLDGDFLDYKKSVPTTFSVNAVVDKADFQRAVERVSLIIDDRVKNPIRFLFTDGEVKMSCVTPLGRADDVCGYDGGGNDVEIAFNNRYLLDAFRAAPEDTLSIGLNSGSSPCVISSAQGGDRFLYMILPVRIRT